jgi:hypothetical protein
LHAEREPPAMLEHIRRTVHTLKSLSSLALLAVSQLCTTRSKRGGNSSGP